MTIEAWTNQIEQTIHELIAVHPLTEKNLLVVGVSTSEVIGQHIGSAGSADVAKAIYNGISKVQQQFGFHVAFQSCEHINRALCIERDTLEQFRLEEVGVIPSPKAGGSMASYAYRQMKDPVMVETIRADVGIDIGDTFIGMHLKPVAVPVRPSVRELGLAHVTMARTRPKLIGGERAIYR